MQKQLLQRTVTFCQASTNVILTQTAHAFFPGNISNTRDLFLTRRLIVGDEVPSSLQCCVTLENILFPSLNEGFVPKDIKTSSNAEKSCTSISKFYETSSILSQHSVSRPLCNLKKIYGNHRNRNKVSCQIRHVLVTLVAV